MAKEKRVFLGPMPPEPKRDASTAKLHSGFAALLATLLEKLAALGEPGKMIEGYRSPERQRWLYGIGRIYGYEGECVTNRNGSRIVGHMLGTSADLWSASPTGRVLKIANDDPWWTKMGTQAESIGLIWGGRWTHLGDKDHVELATK